MMVLFSRSFVRKRVISLATTVAVSATSFAFAPPKMGRVRGAMPIQTAADRPDHSEEQPFLSENAAMNKMMADMTVKPTGSAIVNATGAIRQVVHGEDNIQRRYLVIAEGRADMPGRIVQTQLK
jgi:hypothetical protein